jgi:ElaB/YqjD/DUF883 family membrane-anchored ribosome-binding protein
MATTSSDSPVLDKPAAAAAAGDEAMTAVQKLREQADAVVQRIQPQIAAVSTFARAEPTKALLISAAAGAALMGLVALVVRASGRTPLRDSLMTAGASAMAAIRDAALDLADSAQSMASDALDAAQQRATDAVGAAQQRAAEALTATQKRAAEALDATQQRAYAALDAGKKRAAAAADSAVESAAEAWQKVRDQAAPVVDKIKPQLDAAAQYARDEPTRTVLGLVAAGAVIAGLIALARSAEDD